MFWGFVKEALKTRTVIAELLKDLVERGVKPKQKRLFIIDGSKALRAGLRKSSANNRCNAVGRTGTECGGTVARSHAGGGARADAVCVEVASGQGFGQLEKLATTLDKSALSAAKAYGKDCKRSFPTTKLQQHQRD